MTRLGFCVCARVVPGASMMSAQAPAPRRAPPSPAAARRQAFQPPPDLSEVLLRMPRRHQAQGRRQHRASHPAVRSVVRRRVLGGLGQGRRDAGDAARCRRRTRRNSSRPTTNARRRRRGSGRRLSAYEAEHAGDPGRVTVRRLTSAEYAYAIRDLTGIDIKVGVDASSDSVGGEGFTNFGDVQFVEDTSIERYLEAAKLVADHAVVGAGPLEFYADAGKTGLELSALSRINDLYADEGVSRGVRRRRTPVRARPVRQGVVRRLVLQTPRRAGRSRRDDSRTRGEGRHHRPLCRAHLDGGQQAEHRVSDARDGGRLDEPARADLRRQRVAGQGARRLRRSLQSADHLAKLVLCSRRSGGRRRGRRESAGVRRHDAQGRADSPLHVRVGRSRRSRARRAAPTPGPAKVYLTFTDVNPTTGRDARGHLAQPARGHARRGRARARRARRRGARRAVAVRRRPRSRRRRPDSVHATAARRAAGRRRRRRWRSGRAPTEPRWARTISRRPERCRSRSTCLPAATSWSSRRMPSSAGTGTPWCA